MRNMAAQSISSKVGSIFPFGGIRCSCARVTQVAMLDLAMECKPLVHLLYTIYQ